MRLEPTDIGKLFAASTIGSIFGALVMGPLADRHGRKPILIIALIITTVTTFACAAAETFQHLAALRFLAGVGLGGALVTVIALAAESIGPERRASSSEEHTSELQSLMRISYAVFCLKKKTTYLQPTLT